MDLIPSCDSDIEDDGDYSANELGCVEKVLDSLPAINAGQSAAKNQGIYILDMSSYATSDFELLHPSYRNRQTNIAVP